MDGWKRVVHHWARAPASCRDTATRPLALGTGSIGCASQHGAAGARNSNWAVLNSSSIGNLRPCRAIPLPQWVFYLFGASAVLWIPFWLPLPLAGPPSGGSSARPWQPLQLLAATRGGGRQGSPGEQEGSQVGLLLAAGCCGQLGA